MEFCEDCGGYVDPRRERGAYPCECCDQDTYQAQLNDLKEKLERLESAFNQLTGEVKNRAK